MSEDTGRRILLLSVRCIVFLGLFFVLWVATSGAYSRLIAGTLDAGISSVEDLELTESVRYDAASHAIVVHSRAVADPDRQFHAFDAEFHFGTVLFAGLIFATLPNISLLARLALVVSGLVLLFPVHLLEMHVFNQVWYAFEGANVTRSYTDAQRSFYNWFAQVLKHGETAFPLVLWVFPYFWLRRREPGRRNLG